MQNLFNALLHHPGAAMDHLRAYGQLASAEMNQAMRTWQRRALLTAGALVCAALAFGFAGMTLMAWALMPTAITTTQWMIIASPSALSGIASVVCIVLLRGTARPAPLKHLARQWQLDVGWLLPSREEAP